MAHYSRRNTTTTRRVHAEGIECPNCGNGMILRTSARGQFYGCAKFPKCRGTREAAQPERAPIERLEGSHEQTAFWSACTDSASHIVLQARAGTGKTTSNQQATVRLYDANPDYRIVCLAFNKHSALDAAAKMPQAVASLTCHSFGYSAITAVHPCELNKHKIENIIAELLADDDAETQAEFPSNALEKLVSLTRGTLTNPLDLAALTELCELYNIETNSHHDRVLSLVAPVIQRARAMRGIIDFDDMIDFPVTFPDRYPVRRFDFVIGDEVQDWNRQQQELALMARADTGRIILAGDDRQSIYAFRGADSESIPRMIALLDATPNGVDVMPLTISRRCPAQVVKLAQSLVPDFRHLDDAPPGVIEESSEDAAHDLMTPGDIVLCRTNAPLLASAYRLIKRGIPAKVAGREIGKGLQAVIKKTRAKTLDQLADKLAEYEVKERAAILNRNPRAKLRADNVSDKVECIRIVMAMSRDLADLRARIDDLFADFDASGNTKTQVLLSSIHKAKGLEATRVFIMRPELLPHPMATTPRDRAQELNLAYVAATRVKFERGNSHTGRLIFVGKVPAIFSAAIEPPSPAPPAITPGGECAGESSERQEDSHQLMLEVSA